MTGCTKIPQSLFCRICLYRTYYGGQTTLQTNAEDCKIYRIIILTVCGSNGVQSPLTKAEPSSLSLRKPLSVQSPHISMLRCKTINISNVCLTVFVDGSKKGKKCAIRASWANMWAWRGRWWGLGGWPTMIGLWRRPSPIISWRG